MNRLIVVVYHYVRDAAHSRFPHIRGLSLKSFREQVVRLRQVYEMATIESALAFLSGGYHPLRVLCLLTFDDGLKEHADEVTPILAELSIQGLFFLSTGCQAGRILTVHKNHLLTAELDFRQYKQEVLDEYRALVPDADVSVDATRAREIYRWDDSDHAALKYLLNYRMPVRVRDRVLETIFCRHFTNEAALARDLYLDWNDARDMQSAGMVLGGHSDAHSALATMSESGQVVDLETCARQLRANTMAQPLWPFSYPYGTPVETFNDTTIRIVRELGFCCAFSTEVGVNVPGQNLFAIRRIDTNDLQQEGQNATSDYCFVSTDHCSKRITT